MASARCGITAIGLCIVHVWVVLGELSPLSTYVTPVRIEISKTFDLRYLSVRYRASSKPFVTWDFDFNTFTELDSNLELFNDFSEITHNGVAVILLPIGYFWTDPPSDVSVYMNVDGAAFNLILNRTYDILNRENFVHNMNPVYYDTGPETELEYVKGEQLSIDLSLRSADIGEYRVIKGSGRIDSFDYELFPPERIQRWSLTPTELTAYEDFNGDVKPFLCADNFEEINATSLTRHCTINTTVDNLAGRVKFYLTVNPRERHSAIRRIDFFRYIYIKEVGQIAPYRENSLLVMGVPNLARVGPDARIRNSNPEFTYTAIGYPKPQVYIKRGCGTSAQPIRSTEVPSSVMRYQTTMRFKFLRNITRTVEETYIITAKSGNFQISDFVTVGRSTY